jgi:hypothetical protein
MLLLPCRDDARGLSENFLDASSRGSRFGPPKQRCCRGSVPPNQPSADSRPKRKRPSSRIWDDVGTKTTCQDHSSNDSRSKVFDAAHRHVADWLLRRMLPQLDERLPNPKNARLFAFDEPEVRLPGRSHWTSTCSLNRCRTFQARMDHDA